MAGSKNYTEHLMADRAEKCLRMSRNCSEKLGDTRTFCYSFAIELLLRGQFSASVEV